MIAVDTNLLVYAHRRESDLHEAAYAVLRSLAEGDMGWAIPWPCCYEFFSIVTIAESGRRPPRRQNRRGSNSKRGLRHHVII